MDETCPLAALPCWAAFDYHRPYLAGQVTPNRYRRKLKAWLLEARAAEASSCDDQFVEGRHVSGCTPVGAVTETSVVGACGFSREAPDLVVIGASTVPTAGGKTRLSQLKRLLAPDNMSAAG